MSRKLAPVWLLAAVCWHASVAIPAGESGAPVSPVHRVEARSGTFLAVGIVREDHMAIHLSRLGDNAPVRDATLTVLMRGVTHPTTAESDGSYTLQTPDLLLPGTASLQFQVARGDVHEELTGTLQSGESALKPGDKNSARQLWWWVLNFAVCGGFLMLFSRRRKAAAAAATAE